MDLGGTWLAIEADEELRRRLPDPDLDERDWLPAPVPGHWRAVPGLCGSDGPVLYRRHFDRARPAPGRRVFLTFDGIFYQGDVWLDGAYLGDTEGYFWPHTFEVTEQLAARTEHVLAAEVACSRPAPRTAKRNLTGIFQHGDCIDPSWNPGGLWAPVHLDETGPVRLASLKVLCRDATAERAILELEAELDTREAVAVALTTTVTREVDLAAPTLPGAPPPRRAASPGGAAAGVTVEGEHALAAGANRVRWRAVVERPDLWWPHALGAQPLYQVTVEARPRPGPRGDRGGAPGPGAGEPSDRRTLTTGLRQIRLRDFVATVNGERLFLKGANCGPTRRGLGDATPAEVVRDVTLAREAGLDLLRVHAHVTRAELYEAADRAGMLLWQDLPLQWGYGHVRRQAVTQARRAVTLLGHHPSVAIWCGHNEPFPLDPAAESTRKTTARFLAGQVLPSWNKTALDRSIRRALERADGSRPVVAHSGLFPHPAWGTDSHLYFGWYYGAVRDLGRVLARLPVLGRFVSEFGAQAVPSEAAFMHPERWPDLDWDELRAHHGLQKEIFDRRVPPAAFQTFGAWRAATQAYQAELVRHHVETLRRLKYRPTGGFCQFLLADAQPMVSWSLLDHRRTPKAAYAALARACAPVIVVADPLDPAYRPGDEVAVDLHAVSDLRVPLPGVTTTATLAWPGGSRTWHFAGDLAADSCARIGRLRQDLPAGGGPGEVRLTLELRAPGRVPVSNRYSSWLTAGLTS